VVGVDPSEGFLATARARIDDPRAAFQPADARSLPFPDDRFDAVVGGLVLNFVPDPATAVAEWARVAAPGAVVAAYVWDYAEGMRFMRQFWDAAIAVDPAAADLDELRRFPICRPEPLRGLWDGAGLGGASVTGLEIPTVFTDFDDFWRPFLGGQGPAPGYLMSRDDEHRAAIRDLLVQRLPRRADGSIPLTARAWAVKGVA
jgi:SAM-dependent methyltransferase